MELIILSVICIVYMIISYAFSRKDIMTPSILLCAGYLVSCICCAMNIEWWEIDLRLNTIIFLLVGISLFVLAEIYFQLVRNKFSKKNEKNCYIEERQLIKISNTKFAVAMLIHGITAYFYIQDILRICGGNLGNISLMLDKYRRAWGYGDAQLSTLAVQSMKLSKAIGYTFLYIFFNNIFLLKKDQIILQLKYLIPAVTYILITFLMGGRINMITFAVASIFLAFYNWNRKNEWKKKINVKFIKNICITLVIFLLIFYFSKTFVGRKTTRNLIDYMTVYMGGSIQLLDEYLNDETYEVKKGETFPGLLQSLYKLGFSNISVRKSLEFRHVLDDGEYLGNVYTGLRRMYNDYGYFGMMLIQILYSWLFNWIYYKIKTDCKDTYTSKFWVIFYAQTIYCIIIQSMEDAFFINLSLGYFIELIILYLIIRILLPKSKVIIKQEKNNG